VVQQEAGDAQPGRQVWKVADREPPGVLGFCRVDVQIPAGVRSGEPKHELTGEGPALDAGVLEVVDLNSSLLADLAAGRRHG